MVHPAGTILDPLGLSDIKEKSVECLNKVKEEEKLTKKVYEFRAKDGTIISCKTKERLEEYKKLFK